MQLAGLTPLFSDIYLDLGFVEANLKATGPVDLLSDYKRYREYIIGEAMEHDDALTDFEEFCRTVGSQAKIKKEEWNFPIEFLPSLTIIYEKRKFYVQFLYKVSLLLY